MHNQNSQKLNVDRVRKSRKGQAAIILIIAAAAGLIFMAMANNLGIMAQHKALTLTAAGNSTSFMTSMVASWGERLFQETLGGKEEICGWTFIAVIFLIIIVIIIIIVVMIFTKNYVGLVKAIIGLIYAIIALVIQLVAVEPGITRNWNRMMAEALPGKKDQAIERGLQLGLAGSVSDLVEVPDLFDTDTDLLFGPESVPGDINTAIDVISRYGFLMSERLKTIEPATDTTIQSWLTGLRELMFRGVDDWGLYDPIRCEEYIVNPEVNPCCTATKGTNSNFPAVCDPCCQHPSIYPRRRWKHPVFGNIWITGLPKCCEASFIGPKCGNPSSCVPRTVFRNIASLHPSISEALSTDKGSITVYLDNFENNFGSTGHPQGLFLSFREILGFDDLHHAYRVRRNNPTYFPPDTQQYQPSGPNRGFFLEDASGFYRPPVYTTGALDNRPGLMSYFYKAQDWGIAGADISFAGVQCHWCDARDPTNGTCTVPLPVEIPQPIYPGPFPPPAIAGLGCLDRINLAANTPPQVLDNIVSFSNLITSPIFLFTPNSECPTGPNGVGGWRRGADMFCSTQWPYFETCAKHIGSPQCEVPGSNPPIQIDCLCGENSVSKSAWPDDNIDVIVNYDMPQLAVFGRKLLKLGAEKIAADYETLYDLLADWIEPACLAPPCPGSYTGLPREGNLFSWRNWFKAFHDAIMEWEFPTLHPPYVGTSCFDVWCVPPPQGSTNKYGINECRGVTVSESLTFNASGGTRGDIDDILSCLDWQVNDTYTYADLTFARGNAQKFQACLTACQTGQSDALKIEKCSNLPRSLVPLFNNTIPEPFVPTQCASPAFILGLQQSVAAAIVQVEKTRKRQTFMNNLMLQGRTLRSQLDKVVDELTAFIDGGDDYATAINSPSESMIEARKHKMGQLTSSLPSVVVYSWQDYPTKKQRRNNEDGFWHAVKVETRVPERCNFGCGGGWPTVKTKTKWLGFRRCYYLANKNVMTKTRVIRFDEDKSGASMKFPTGQLIWETIRFFHPDAGPATNVGQNFMAKCRKQINPNLLDKPWENAVMLFDIPYKTGAEADPEYDECWKYIHQNMIEHGYGSDVCARTYLGSGLALPGQHFAYGGFRFAFEECDAGFISGAN